MRRFLCLAACSLFPLGIAHAAPPATAFEPPKAEAVRDFTNGLPPATGERQEVSKAFILVFLSEGKVTGQYPTPNQLGNAFSVTSNAQRDGVFTDMNGQFYFWKLISPTVLQLRTPQGGAIIIQIAGK